MISLQTSKENLPEDSSSKKRKWHDPAEEVMQRPGRIKIMNTVFDSHLHSKTAFPLGWQRCLDIKSGQIYYYNTRTKTRVLDDQKPIVEPAKPAPMSLELELNLPCQPLGRNQVVERYRKQDSGSTSILPNNRFKNSSGGKGAKGLTRSPSWLTFEDDQQEMVTAVCKKCYMLVMMCKSSPACPNCKFVHPSEPSPDLFNQRIGREAKRLPRADDCFLQVGLHESKQIESPNHTVKFLRNRDEMIMTSYATKSKDIKRQFENSTKDHSIKRVQPLSHLKWKNSVAYPGVHDSVKTYWGKRWSPHIKMLDNVSLVEGLSA